MYFSLMDNISFANTQDKLTQTARHGYAVFADDILIGWSLTLRLAAQTPSATRLVNVQNGAYITVENGEITGSVNANDIPKVQAAA